MKHLDLFSGIGGFALAASWVWGENHKIHSFVENDLFCQKVLKKHWSGTKIHSDIKEYKHDGTTIDLLTGGFPCQPFSIAGKQGSKTDNRYLWPEMLRIIGEAKPLWVIGENVFNIINLELDNVLFDLESFGYTCESFIIPACGINASHRRDRVFIIAYSECGGRQAGNSKAEKRQRETKIRPIETLVDDKNGRKMPKPEFLRGNDGLSFRLDRHRVKSLGNAIVPQVVVPIMQAIKDIDEPN